MMVSRFLLVLSFTKKRLSIILWNFVILIMQLIHPMYSMLYTVKLACAITYVLFLQIQSHILTRGSHYFFSKEYHYFFSERHYNY